MHQEYLDLMDDMINLKLRNKYSEELINDFYWNFSTRTLEFTAVDLKSAETLASVTSFDHFKA